MNEKSAKVHEIVMEGFFFLSRGSFHSSALKIDIFQSYSVWYTSHA